MLRRQKPIFEEMWVNETLKKLVVVTPLFTPRWFYMNYRDGSQRRETFLVSEFLRHIRSQYNVRAEFFKTVNGLIKLAQLGRKDRSIKRITFVENGKAACVKLEVTKPRWSRSIELWAVVDGIWHYRETVK